MSVYQSHFKAVFETELAQGRAGSSPESRKQQILAAAVLECSEKGFSAATVVGVAKRAGVSTATLYRVYAEKTDLFIASVVYLIPIIAQALTQQVEIDDPFERVVGGLINHGKTFGDPFLTQLYRMYVSADTSEFNQTLPRIARAGRQLTEQYWSSELQKLELEGMIAPSDHSVTINLLLGAIEKQTILSQLMFEETDFVAENVERAARFAALALFKNLGTDKYRARALNAGQTSA